MENKLSRFKAREQGFILIFEKIFNEESLDTIIENAEQSRDIVFDSYAKELVDNIPDGVAINEAVELAKKYTVDDSKFINGVLGAVSRDK